MLSRPTNAEQVYSWISRHLPDGPKPEIVRPINYVRLAAVTTTILGFITLFSAMSSYILPVIQNRNVWAAISLISILLFTSGHMFNSIRKVPYVTGDGKGGISYFAPGFSTQFGLETQVIAAICKLFFFFTLFLPEDHLSIDLSFYNVVLTNSEQQMGPCLLRRSPWL